MRSGHEERTLVAGGAGFIGSHLCRELAREGTTVEVWRRPGSRADATSLAGVPGVEVHAVDVRDRGAVAAALTARPPSRAFLLAGLRLLDNRAESLARMVETHVLGALHLLEGLRSNARAVIVGSCEEYGRGPVPFRESQSAEARTGYAISRLAATQACLAVASPRVCVARLTVVYGPGQVGEMFVPSLVAACAQQRTFSMTRGDQTRDFLYVEDAVRALVALAKAEQAMGQIVNVGSGVECTVRDVAKRVAQLSGQGANLKIGAIESRPGEASRYVCSIERLNAVTGWTPRIGLDEGLRRTLDWWRAQAHAADPARHAHGDVRREPSRNLG